MNAIAEYPGQTVYSTAVRPSPIDWTVFWQLCVCVFPAMAAIDFASPLLGAQYLAGSLFLMLMYHVIKRDRYRYMCLLLGAEPALSLLRGAFFYDSIFFFLALGTVLWAVVAWKEVRFVWQDPTWKSVALLCLIYWLLSVAIRGNLGANLRALEFALGAASVCLLANRRSYLATGLIGILISASAYAIAMLPYGVRLGEGELDNGETIGNPVLMGVPCALLVLLALTDRGRYLMLESKATARLVICIIAGQWLVLSGSRGSWLITIMCLLIVYAYSKPSRKTITIAIGLGVLATMVVLSTERGSQISTVFSKTVDGDRSLNNRTSGRSSQWEALPQIFAISPIWGWGPGNGGDVDYIFTHRHLIFHSLYEQIIAETGLMGFIPLMCILGVTLHRTIRHYRKYGELTPMVGIVGFMMIGVSVTAFDFISGVFLGLALIAREPTPRFVMRELSVRQMEEEPEELAPVPEPELKGTR
jgi:O-antigen ligase